MKELPRFPVRELSENPADAVSAMRAAGPLVEISVPVIGKAILPTTHHLSVSVLKYHDRFRQRSRSGHVAGLRWWMPRTIRILARNMLTMDGDEHRRLRAMVDAAFQRRNIVAMEPHIAEIADGLIDAMDAGNPVDLVSAYASQLPLAVICELLGLPARDRPQFTRWASGFTSAGSLLGVIRAIPHIRALARYLEDFIGDTAKHGGEGLAAELVREFDTGERSSREELIAMTFLLLVAGHQTTTHLISGSVLALLTHPEQKRRFLDEPDIRAIAVEEFLRYVSPVLLTKPRIAAGDTEIAGCPVSQGTMFMPFIAAANRDPEIFDKPDELDITRKPNRHVAFGTGVHFCLGHQLARIEAKVALERLFERYPDLRLAVAPGDIEYYRRTGLRAMKALPVVLDPSEL